MGHFVSYMKPFLLFLVLFAIGNDSSISYGEKKEYEEEVIIYTTYGYLDGDEWIVPMRIYVVEDRDYLESLVTGLIGWSQSLTQEEKEIFASRISDFVKDSESREEVIFVFENDPQEEAFQVQDDDGNYPRTNLNGIIEGHIRIPEARAEELLDAQNSDTGWLEVRVVSDEHIGGGRIRLIEPAGLSVISDIDDTVKITGMPMGLNYIIRKTFLEEYVAAPGMADLYQTWSESPFHYVSGTPWQFYRPLTAFLFSEEAGFPPGSMHMKFTPKNFGSRITWSTLSNLVTNELVTYEQKLEQISTIFRHFPGREFVLIGDSGERDPEVYREIARLYPDQVREIYIRDVINDRELNPERLEGMAIIPAPTFERTDR
ncbi:DUF2183 domain-containing protein [Balneolales bacterium ANBcel1]|nr:DUF2183 domain-containing protein [Balneolales bacterium ANBcel1]